MRETLARLRQLQKLDSRLLELEQKRRRLAAEVAGREAAIRTREAEMTERDDQGMGLQKHLDRKELSLKELEEKIERLSAQLNQIKRNKEYAALQHEIAGSRADLSLIEDEILALLETIEKAADEGRRLAEASVAEQSQTAEFRRKTDAEMGRMAQEAASLQNRREELARRTDPEKMGAYERLLARQGGMAIVRAVASDGGAYNCAGCFMRLTSNTVNRLMSPHELQFCHSCGRILYLDDTDK